MDDGFTYKDMIKMDYPEILKKGFLLEWNASHCSECEGSGGRGGFQNTTSSVCYDGPHPKSCITLISSKPAVDINRHRYEISLANMAINKVQNHLIHELVDPHLGFDSDYSVRKMVTLVAELAFRYLQQDKDMRPSMVEVLDVLKFIEKQDYIRSRQIKWIPSEEFRLLKNIPPLSADSVSDSWLATLLRQMPVLMFPYHA
ncbi:hypothetical protein GIB67_017253 [Kingdonia uniflora]|uniref:Wall-associated receptor kinase C-terminal domain-containing protein n=1 Tax=Kingdonia uniflora TaxID=39325 RepID=A0A7J7LX40_9MAGN|nr:hypothetical protein GIB67_017253 [Kingdonia uniflora]